MTFEDVMELKSKFGTAAADFGIREAFLISYQAKGKFFGYDCDCYLYFDSDQKFTDYDLSVYGDKNGKLIEILNDIYSGPISSDMTPYVASNGGAVYNSTFEDPDALITVSLSQKDYIKVKIKPNPDPGFFGTLTLKPAGFKGFFPKGAEADPAGYENGVLTVKVSNHTEAPLALSDDFELYERRESSYCSKFRITMPFSPNKTAAVLPEETAEIRLDLRAFGKVTPNEYMVRFSGIELYFVLTDE